MCIYLIICLLTVSPAFGAISQADLNNLAMNIIVHAEVIDNLRNGWETHDIKISLKNNGSGVVPSAGWKLFFHSAYVLFPETFPDPPTKVLDTEKVKVTMYGGDLYSIEPADGFKEIAPDEARMIYMVVQYWSVSKTDFMPNWYLVSDEPDVKPRVVKSTDSETLDFVEPFDKVNQWKRYNFDRYNPFSPQMRFDRLKVRDNKNAKLAVLPTPMDMTVNDNGLTLTMDSTWQIFGGSGDVGKAAKLLTVRLNTTMTNTTGPKTISLSVDESTNKSYLLNINPASNMITVQGGDAAGVYYGVQSLLSLRVSYPGGLPSIQIKDKPRFEYRGMHVDVARNFRSTEDLKILLEAMAMYKLNKLHLHLSDDEGWRLEIPGLPELTEVGAERCHDLSEQECIKPQWGSGPENTSSGTGFFTTDDYKDLLKFADDRFIEVIPEFDMPGHAHAAIKSMEARYWKLSAANTSGAEEFRLIDPDDNSSYLSVQGWRDNAVNPCVESTYNFIRKVIDVVVEMHKDIQPLKTYHFGGDEVANGAWENSLVCHNFLKDNPEYNISKGLKTYFAKRVSNLTAEKGLTLTGWEEGFIDGNGDAVSLENLENANMVADAWNNIWEWETAPRAYKLANAGYKVVMAQGTDLYFDQPYEPDPKERGLYWASRYIDTKKVFTFMPDSLYDNIDARRSGKPLTKTDICGLDFSKCDTLKEKDNIIGMQGHLWTETVRTRTSFHYMIFPRLLALAERAWHKARFEEEGISKDDRERRQDEEWEKFANTLGYQELKRLDDLGIEYRIPPPGATVSKDGLVEASVTFPGLMVEYSTDNGKNWQELSSGESRPFGSRDMMHLRTKSAGRYSRVVELYKEEPLPWTDQDTIDYIGSHLSLKAGVISNFDKIDGEFVPMVLQLHNIWGETINKGTWKIFFNVLHGAKIEDLDCGLRVGHVTGDLYFFTPTSMFAALKPGRQLQCTWHQKWWNVAESDFFPNWYVSSEGMIPRLIANTSELSLFIMPHDTKEKWKRSEKDKYNPYTELERFFMNDMKGTGQRNLLIPKPYGISNRQGDASIELTRYRGWQVVHTLDFPKQAKFLADKLRLSISTANLSKNMISFSKETLPENNDEAYHLKISSEHINITAQHQAGAFYAVQTLISLWEAGDGKVQTVDITDLPRFEYRGVMIDTARNFIAKEWIMKLLDVMGMYKLNRLHLRLTDNEAWRLEIPGLPELTEVGSKRCHDGETSVCLKPQRGSGPISTPVGSGYFTVQDYKEILQHAADRHITVIPEINMPGHSRAAITSMMYREYKKNKLFSRGADISKIVSYALSDADLNNIGNWHEDVLNPCLNSTYEFIGKVIDELEIMHIDANMNLTTVHLGGDMIPDGSWDNLKTCENIGVNKTTIELKQDFDKRVAAMLLDKGLEVSFREDAFYGKNGPVSLHGTAQTKDYVYTWNNMWEGGKAKRSAELADAGHKVILATGTHLYLDAPYEPDPKEYGVIGSSRFIDTKKIFGFIPEDLFANADVDEMGKTINMTELCENTNCAKTNKSENIIGLQGSTFSDQITTEEKMQYMLFPRLLALAERAWHKASWEDIGDKSEREKARKEDWERFVNTLGHQELPRLDNFNISYRVPPLGFVAYREEFRPNTLYPSHDIEMSLDDGKTWTKLGEGKHTWEPGTYTVLFRTLSAQAKRPSRTIVYQKQDWRTSKSASVNICILLLIVCLTQLTACL